MIQSLPVEYQPQELAAYGLTPQAAAEQVRNAIYGVEVAEVNEGVRRFAIVVRLVDEARDDITDLRRLILRGQGGGDIIADIALPLPVQMISEMLGMPTEDADQLKTWSAAMAKTLDPLISDEERAAEREALDATDATDDSDSADLAAVVTADVADAVAAELARDEAPEAPPAAEAKVEQERIFEEMVAWQEELDWRCYVSYGLLEEDEAPVVPDDKLSRSID